MSLFRLREYWSSPPPKLPPTFPVHFHPDSPPSNILIANDECDRGTTVLWDKYIVTGSLRGMLRVYCPSPPAAKIPSTTSSSTSASVLTDLSSLSSVGDIVFEMSLPFPILQISIGHFLPFQGQNNQKSQTPTPPTLCLLHPSRIIIFTLTLSAVTKQLDFVKLCEHKFPKEWPDAVNFCFGPFGTQFSPTVNKQNISFTTEAYANTSATSSPTPIDSLCIQHFHGLLSFYSSDHHLFHRYLPSSSSLLPSPSICYLHKTDSIILSTTEMKVESYKYSQIIIQQVDESQNGRRGGGGESKGNGNIMETDETNDNEETEKGDSSSLSTSSSIVQKSLTPDWSLNVGEFVLLLFPTRFSRSLPSSQYDILVITESTLFTLKESNGEMRIQKRLGYSAACAISYSPSANATHSPSGPPSSDSLHHLIISSHPISPSLPSTLYIYRDTQLIWSCLAPFTPIDIIVGDVMSQRNLIILRGERGEMGCYYVGTAPPKNYEYKGKGKEKDSSSSSSNTNSAISSTPSSTSTTISESRKLRADIEKEMTEYSHLSLSSLHSMAEESKILSAKIKLLQSGNETLSTPSSPLPLSPFMEFATHFHYRTQVDILSEFNESDRRNLMENMGKGAKYLEDQIEEEDLDDDDEEEEGDEETKDDDGKNPSLSLRQHRRAQKSRGRWCKDENNNFRVAKVTVEIWRREEKADNVSNSVGNGDFFSVSTNLPSAVVAFPAVYSTKSIAHFPIFPSTSSLSPSSPPPTAPLPFCIDFLLFLQCDYIVNTLPIHLLFTYQNDKGEGRVLRTGKSGNPQSHQKHYSHCVSLMANGGKGNKYGGEDYLDQIYYPSSPLLLPLPLLLTPIIPFKEATYQVTLSPSPTFSLYLSSLPPSFHLLFPEYFDTESPFSLPPTVANEIMKTSSTAISLQLFSPSHSLSSSSSSSPSTSVLLPPVVSILFSKKTNRWRIQSTRFECISLIVNIFEDRMREYGKKLHATMSTTTTKASTGESLDDKSSPSLPSSLPLPLFLYSDPLPLGDFFIFLDNHFHTHRQFHSIYQQLQRESLLYRLIQRRMISRYKEKNSPPLNGMNVLLEEVHEKCTEYMKYLVGIERMREKSLNKVESSLSLLIQLCVWSLNTQGNNPTDISSLLHLMHQLRHIFDVDTMGKTQNNHLGIKGMRERRMRNGTEKGMKRRMREMERKEMNHKEKSLITSGQGEDDDDENDNGDDDKSLSLLEGDDSTPTLVTISMGYEELLYYTLQWVLKNSLVKVAPEIPVPIDNNVEPLRDIEKLKKNIQLVFERIGKGIRFVEINGKNKRKKENQNNENENAQNGGDGSGDGEDQNQSNEDEKNGK